MNKQGVLYARYSPRPENQSMSGEMQLEYCRKYCSFHEYEIIGEFLDEAISGKEAENREGFQKAIELACKQKAVFVCYSLSRFARSTTDAIKYANILNKAKADLASLREQLDTSSPMGKFLFTIMAALSQLEREQIGQRTSDAMLALQGRGIIMGAKLPFGFERDPGNPALMVECEHEQEIISEVLRMNAAGYSYRRISKDLWLNGYIGRREPKFEMKKAERGTGRKTTRTDRVLAWSIGIITPGLICTILKRAK